MSSRRQFKNLSGHRRAKTWTRRHPWQGWKNDRAAGFKLPPRDRRKAVAE